MTSKLICPVCGGQEVQYIGTRSGIGVIPTHEYAVFQCSDCLQLLIGADLSHDLTGGDSGDEKDAESDE